MRSSVPTAAALIMGEQPEQFLLRGLCCRKMFVRPSLCHTPVFYRNGLMYRVFQKKVAPPPKTVWNIFTLVKSFCVKFGRFVGHSYPYIGLCTSFCRFILIFHKIALIFPQVPIVFTLSCFE